MYSHDHIQMFPIPNSPESELKNAVCVVVFTSTDDTLDVERKVRCASFVACGVLTTVGVY
jgi:hypothetical protein